MPISLCKHSFPVTPPRGSMNHPGDCRGCDITYGQARAASRPARRRTTARKPRPAA
ncbi:hypothetical protein ACFWIO_34980 [Streptomyces diastatochromogenes]|uniref:hypothetical protein n=1 Tax=Streptomyces diastatochromogenes TaxID=42236 RepID=UPI00365DD916